MISRSKHEVMTQGKIKEGSKEMKPRRSYQRVRETVAEDWLLYCCDELNLEWLKKVKIYVCPTCQIPTLLSVWTANWSHPLPNEGWFTLISLRTRIPFLHIDYGMTEFKVRNISHPSQPTTTVVDDEYLLTHILNFYVCCRNHYFDYPPQECNERPVFHLEGEIEPSELERWHRSFFPSEWRLSDLDFIVFLDGKLHCIIEAKCFFTIDGQEVRPTEFNIPYSKMVADLLKVPLHLLITVDLGKGWFIPHVKTSRVRWDGQVSPREKVIPFMVRVLRGGD